MNRSTTAEPMHLMTIEPKVKITTYNLPIFYINLSINKLSCFSKHKRSQYGRNN